MYLYIRKRHTTCQEEEESEMTQKDPSDEELMLRIRETMLAEKLRVALHSATKFF